VSSPTHTEGVILAGQHTWSDSTLEVSSPRPVLPVGNRPLASYAARWLHQGGVRDVIVCANRETRIVGSLLREHVPADLNLRISEDLVPRGPAGCVRDAVTGNGGPVVVVDGTSVPLVDLGELLARHRESRATLTVVVRMQPGDGPEGRHEPCGIYVFERRALDHVLPRGFCDIKEGLIPRLHRAGERTLAFPVREASPRVVDGPSYLTLNEWMVERLADAPPPGYVRTSGLIAHETARIAPDAVCLGPVLVGPGAQVMARATLVGPASIGGRSTVGAGALVSRSAVWNRCVVGMEAVADRCILADDSTIAARAHVVGFVRSSAPAAHHRIKARSRTGAPLWLNRLWVPARFHQGGPLD
jgi:NDP-sugar pyrophosphorylase family protein